MLAAVAFPFFVAAADLAAFPFAADWEVDRRVGRLVSSLSLAAGAFAAVRPRLVTAGSESTAADFPLPLLAARLVVLSLASVTRPLLDARVFLPSGAEAATVVVVVVFGPLSAVASLFDRWRLRVLLAAGF